MKNDARVSQVQEFFKLKILCCTICTKDLTPDNTWLGDDTQDGRKFCFDCAPDEAIRVKDLM